MEGILDNVSRPNIHDIKYVTCTEVRDILATMSKNKAGDSYGLCTDYPYYVCVLITLQVSRRSLL